MIRPIPFMYRLIKPTFHEKMNFQKRNCSMYPHGDPDNKPNVPYWVLAIFGVYIICNTPRNPPHLT